MLMNIFYNGSHLSCFEGSKLADLLNQHCNQKSPFAVAINGDFVPRGHYSNIVIQHNDKVDVVSPVTGG